MSVHRISIDQTVAQREGLVGHEEISEAKSQEPRAQPRCGDRGKCKITDQEK